jgi:fumarate reductase subunit D
VVVLLFDSAKMRELVPLEVLANRAMSYRLIFLRTLYLDALVLVVVVLLPLWAMCIYR